MFDSDSSLTSTSMTKATAIELIIKSDVLSQVELESGKI